MKDLVKKKNLFGKKLLPICPAVNRWHIERWVPPETYGSPRNWHLQTTEHVGAQSVPALGPYPSHGGYEHCLTLETPRGEFIQLTVHD